MTSRLRCNTNRFISTSVLTDYISLIYSLPALQQNIPASSWDLIIVISSLKSSHQVCHIASEYKNSTAMLFWWIGNILCYSSLLYSNCFLNIWFTMKCHYFLKLLLMWAQALFLNLILTGISAVCISYYLNTILSPLWKINVFCIVCFKFKVVLNYVMMYIFVSLC